MVQDPATGLFTRRYLEVQTAQAMAQAARRETEVSIMVLGFDAYDSLIGRLGRWERNRSAAVLPNCLPPSCSARTVWAITRPGSSPSSRRVLPRLCASFANRVREAIEVAHVAAHGQRVPLTVSIGVASVPDDAAVSAQALLELAGQRMGEAMAAGAIASSAAPRAARRRRLGLQHAIELPADRADAVLPHLSRLGQQILPLLKVMDKEFGLNLPLADIERRLSQRTRPEEKSGQEIVTSGAGPSRGKSMTTYKEFHRRSVRAARRLLGEQAGLIDWQEPFKQVCDYSRPPFVKWFVGGKTNLCHNAVDRHAAKRPNDRALIYISTETDEEKDLFLRRIAQARSSAWQRYTRASASRRATALIYMPMIAQACFAILACARIGAIHSVVFGGFASGSLATRIDDAKPVLIVSSDAGMRGGKAVPYKNLLDEAINLAEHKWPRC